MAAMRQVWICRHGHREDFIGDQSGGDWHKTAARPHDPALSPLGVRQAIELGRRLRGQGIAHLFASPFLRTVQTAHHVSQAIELPIKIERGICEWLNPKWFAKEPDFLPPAELVRTYPRIDVTYRSRGTATHPEPDEPSDAWPRVRRTVHALLAEFPGDLLFVGHGSSCVGLAKAVAGPGTSVTTKMCSVTRLAFDGMQWSVLDNGCVKHLSESEGEVRLH